MNAKINIKGYVLSFLFILLSESIFSINIDDNRNDAVDIDSNFLPIVFLQIGNTVCSGVLINHRSILTAAHCLKEGESVTVYTGNAVGIPVSQQHLIYGTTELVDEFCLEEYQLVTQN